MMEKISRLQYSLEQVPLSIVMTDLSGTIEYVNQRLADLTGYSIAELIGNKPSIFKSNLNNPDVYVDLWQTITSGNVWKGEFCNKKKNGDLYYESVIIAPIKNLNGLITNYLAIKDDITEKKSLENQLLHSQKLEAIGQLAGGIAHDFNNILTGIIGFGSLMQMKMEKDDPLIDHLNHILSGAEKAATLTKGLLTFSRKQVIKPQPVELNDVIEKIGRFIKPIIGEQINLITSFEHQSLTVVADAGQIDQVLINLVTNARDSMPSGGTLTVATKSIVINEDFVKEFGFGEIGDYACISVTDTGVGMNESTRIKMFEPFFTTKEVGKGTGLGMSIVYGIVKQHMGFINVDSKLGVGTTFKIYIPLAKGVTIVKTNEDVILTGNCSETILVADDDETIRMFAEKVLSSYGYTVILAKDGVDAVQKFIENAESVDLVLLDVIMPNLNGIKANEYIKKCRPDIKIIFMSGYNMEFLESHGIQEVSNEYIEKPFTPNKLVRLIQEKLGNI
jgi:two-component system NtrC family sensor kinase